MLHTPSLYSWTFTGIGKTRQHAERSAYCKFLNDPRILEIADCMVLAAWKVVAVVKQRLHGQHRVDLIRQGFNCKQIAEGAEQEILATFLSMGCRCAIKHNNP